MVVDESGRVEAAEFGRKVGCVVKQVLFYELVRVLQKSPEWFVSKLIVLLYDTFSF